MISKSKCRPFVESLKKEYSVLRSGYFKKDKINDNNLEECRKNKFNFQWDNYEPIKPKKIGVQTQEDVSIEQIMKFADWKPFLKLGNFTEIFLIF